MSTTTTTTIEWHLTSLVRPQQKQPQHDEAKSGTESGGEKDGVDRNGVALIVLNQPIFNHLGGIRTLWDNASIRVAADGGANCLYEAAGMKGDKSLDDLHAIVGDLDSLHPTVKEYYTTEGKPTAIVHKPDQESTDFGKSINYIRDNHGAVDIVAIGGLGGRVDQGLSQLHHLYIFQKGENYDEGRIFLFSGESLTFLLKGGKDKKHVIRVRDGKEATEGEVFAKYVGILPVGEKSRITTRGLEWDVEDWETEFGGKVSTSNHLLPETEVVEVWTEKDVLFTVALKRDS